MMLWHCFIFVSLFGMVSAEGWEDFANNFATDLAPLVALFGERLTKQYLSESTSLLDNLIFALSPLGILTAVVSVIRICGASSLRAFVGRANEAPGEAENELLSCVSDATAELFSGGGISRVLGRPRLLEVVVWEDLDRYTKETMYRLGTLREAIREGAWSEQGEEWALDEKSPGIDIPNLSLNKGIKRRASGWFWAAALLGIVLQGGTLAYAAMTVFWYSSLFKQSGKTSDGYAFPLYLYGSISLSIGMFLCAFIIERSSTEYYSSPATPSKIYWLQPGRQTIGDQDFGAFLAVNEGPDAQLTQDLTYIKSVRSPSAKRRGTLLVFTIFVTMLGFVLQFVGLRGLHPSVIVADIGSTLLMAVVRTCLRTKRIGSDGNEFDPKDRDLFSHNQQELDCFAFRLEKVESFRLVSGLVHQTARSRSGSCSTSDTSIISTLPSGRGARLIKTRARLAELTSCSDLHQSMNWDHLPIRQMARDLARTIEMTMEVVSRWRELPGSTCSFELSFACQTRDHKSTGSSLETYPIVLERSNDTFQWRVDTHALEAILGLWTYSLLKSDPKWLQNGLGRSVGLTKSEASLEATDLYFHKWIFRQREAQMMSSKMISFSEQTFGCYSDSLPDKKEILVVKTENSLEVMAAQDIYIQFLMSILTDIKTSDWDADIVSRSQSSFFAQSTRIDELVNCFETSNLGSREDALLCIVPVLRHQNLLPELAADSKTVRERLERLTSGSLSSEWDIAFAMLRWLCERCEGQEFERSVYELGLLCQRAMVNKDVNVREKSSKLVRSLLERDIRAQFFEPRRPSHWMNSLGQRLWWSNYASQLGWVTWHIVDIKGDRQGIKAFLEESRVSASLVPRWNEGAGIQVRGTQHGSNESLGVSGLSRSSAPQRLANASREHLTGDDAQLIFLKWVIPGFDSGTRKKGLNFDDQRSVETCLQWITQNAQHALCHWISARWVEISQHNHSPIASMVFMYAARTDSGIIIESLRRRGADINGAGPGGCTALIELVDSENQEAAERLLAHGADANICTTGSMLSPLSFAAGQGNEEMSLLLLNYGADLETRDAGGFTPLHTASQEGRLNTVTLLLRRGADIESTARSGNTPLMSAAASCFPEMVLLLAEHGANVNAADLDGSTALMQAVYRGSEALLRVLLDHNASPHKRDDLGRTALDLAKEIGSHTAIIEALEAVS
ncbi:hypothetical protein BJY01DRAFT_247027 [Aspergillus pseudoustus]|uniref:Ankyrin repeat-containing domain protein n=1 Tax=Aspergillus pseudoustus TaxID=1810923 RepID=A0ABR4K3R2_9EURO